MIQAIARLGSVLEEEAVIQARRERDSAATQKSILARPVKHKQEMSKRLDKIEGRTEKLEEDNQT